MKRLFLVLACAALANTAWAQTRTLPPAPMPSGVVQSVQKPTTVLPAATIQQTSHGCLGGPTCCAESCCTPTKTICVPEPSTKVTVKINYSSTCDKICFPKCSFLHCGSCCEGGCGENGQCSSHIYHRNYLVKKVCTTECPTTKCVAIEVPACDHGHGCGSGGGCVNGGGVTYAPAPVVGPAAPIGNPLPVGPAKK
jgi:hypothetical protein